MYEKIAWENFLQTGDIETFLEYKKLIQLVNSLDTESIKRNIDEIIGEKIGEKSI